MSDRLRHFNWHSEDSYDQAGLRAHRAETAMRVHIHQERILDSFRRRLNAESNDPEQVSRQETDELVQRSAAGLELTIY